MSTSAALSSGTAAETAMRLRQAASPVLAAAPVRGVGQDAGQDAAQDSFARLLKSSREAGKESRPPRQPPEHPREATTQPTAGPQASEQAPTPVPGPPRQAPVQDGDAQAKAKQSASEPGHQAVQPEQQDPLRRPDGSAGSAGVRRIWPDTRSAISPQPATPAPADPAENIEDPVDTLMQARKSGRGAEQETKLDPGAADLWPGSQRSQRSPPMVECPYEPGHAAALCDTAAAQQANASEAAATAAAEAKADADETSAQATTRLADSLAELASTPQNTQAPHLANSAAPAPLPGAEAALAGLAQAGGPATAGSGSAAPAAAAATPDAQAQLQAAPGSPAFAGQLAARISFWVRGGVQQAQLLLNPAELGPVQVSIAMEGSAAQVRLVAEHAATRQALEQALPTLASQLAQQGLSLAGGGVFDQATQQHDENPARADQRAAAAEAEGKPLAATMLQPQRRGLLDLMA